MARKRKRRAATPSGSALNKRQARLEARRQARLRDTGPDASGNFDVNPYAARGHVVEVAPRELRRSPDSAFPKRIATQRMVDRYVVHKLITGAEWRAACALWAAFCEFDLGARLTANYDPERIGGVFSSDSVIARKVIGTAEYIELLDAIPYRSRGVVTAVVILDWSASQWAHGRGFRGRDSERHGLDRLRAGLQGLVSLLGY